MGNIDIKTILEENRAEIDAAIERYLPKKYTEQTLEYALGKPRFAYDVSSASDAIVSPVWNFLDRGGKRWRPVLLLLTAEALGADPKKLIDVSIIPELVHNGTIIIDDIEDNSELRRGQPALHKIFGVDVSINAGNTLYFVALLPLMRNKMGFSTETLVKAYEIYSQEMVNVSFGQAFDIWWHRGEKEPNETEYLQMCAYKTGTLARMSAKLGALFANGNEEQMKAAGKFAETVGVAFQIQDDILNITGEEFAKGKGLGEDIHEGKRTLMAIYTLSKASKEDADRLLEILNSHPEDQEVIDEAIAILKKYESVKYAKEKAKELVIEAWSDFDRVFPPSEAKEKIHAFADYLVERDI